VLKTFDYLRYRSNLVNSDILQGDLSEHMNYRGWTNKIKAYTQIREDFRILSNVKMEYNDKNSFRMVALSGSDCGVKNGEFFFSLSQPFAEVYRKMITQYISPVLLSVNTNKYPSAYLIGKKLSEVYSMNRSKANVGMISIGNLIKGNPYIPRI